MATIGPVNLVWLVVGLRDHVTSGLHLLPSITTAPDDKSEEEQEGKGQLRAHGTANASVIQSVAVDDSADDLGEPVQQVVEGSSTDVESSSVHVVVLVGVEDVGGEEHGEQKENPGRAGDGLPQTNKLRLPRRVFHQDNLGAILTNDLVGIQQEEGNNQTEEHENDEGSIGAIADSTGVVLDVLSQGDLKSEKVSISHV